MKILTIPWEYPRVQQIYSALPEALLRPLSVLLMKWLTDKPLEQLEFQCIRGLVGLKEATVNINGNDIRIGVAHGLGNARKLLEDIESGKGQLPCHRNYGLSGWLY